MTDDEILQRAKEIKAERRLREEAAISRKYDMSSPTVANPRFLCEADSGSPRWDVLAAAMGSFVCLKYKGTGGDMGLKFHLDNHNEAKYVAGRLRRIIREIVRQELTEFDDCPDAREITYGLGDEL